MDKIEIELVDEIDGDGYAECVGLLYKESIRDIFNSKDMRLNMGYFLYKIKKNGKLIGFLNIADEKEPNLGAIDIGIIKEEQGKGYAKQALMLLKEEAISLANQNKFFLFGETRENNEKGNGCISELGEYLFKYGDRNIYLFPKELHEEFIENKIPDKVKKHLYDGTPNARKALLDAYESEGRGDKSKING